MEKKRETNRYGSLDILKFILALVIVFHHFQGNTGVKFANFNFNGGAIYFGNAVEFFFIISGFVSAIQMDRIKEKSFGDYFKGKVVRILPYSGLSVVVYTIAMFIYKLHFGHWYKDIVPSIWNIFTSFFLVYKGGAVYSVEFGMNNPMWYLCVLLICYVWLWLILWLCKKIGGNEFYFFWAVMLIGVAVKERGLSTPFLWTSTGRGYAAFFWGMILYYFLGKMKDSLKIIIGGSLFAICSAMYFIDFESFYANQWGALTFVMFPSILMIFLGCNRIFVSKFWNWLGAISFEMYLWHSVLFVIMRIAYNKEKFDVNRIDMLIFALVVIVLSVLIYELIEKPLSRKIRVGMVKDKE